MFQCQLQFRCETHQCSISHSIFLRFIEYILYIQKYVDRNSFSSEKTVKLVQKLIRKEMIFFFPQAPKAVSLELEQ